MLIHIKPLDTLFFRDGKPFGMGEETWTSSSVMPNPSVIWGSLFSMLWAHKLVTKTEIERLSIGRIFLYNQDKGTLYLPAPQDLFQEKNSSKEKLSEKIVFSTYKKEAVISSNNTTIQHFIYPKSDIRTEPLPQAFIKIDDLQDAYYREDKVTVVSIDDINKKDYKLGIGRDNQAKFAEEGALYRIELTELGEGWGFVVETDFDGNFPQKGFIKLGGEGKIASFSQIENLETKTIATLDAKLESRVDEKDTSSVKVYFSSPTFLDEGSVLSDFYKKFDVIAAFVGKPLSIGGFDMAEREPKYMKKAIPAGTIYYLKNKENLTYKAMKQAITDSLAPFNERGFGAFEILSYKTEDHA